MSSIDNTNRPAGAPSQTPSYEPDTIEEKHLKKLLESENGGLDIIALLGLTPGAIEGAFKGVPRAATGNKFTAKGAEVNLPPPPVPRFQVKPHSQAAYESMAADIDHVFSQVRGTLPPVNLGWDTKNIPRGTDPKVAAETAAQGLQRLMTHAQTLTSDQMMLAFLVLRVKDQSDGGQIQKEIQDVASKMRQSELDNQIKRDKEANEKMLKAMEKQQKMGVFSKVLSALVLVLTAIFAVCTFGMGIGLMLVAAAMVIGAVAGGAIKGEKNGKGFDIQGALDGASMAGSIAMLAMGLGAVLIAVTRTMMTRMTGQVTAKMASTAAKAALLQAGNEAAKGSAEAAKQTFLAEFRMHFAALWAKYTGDGALTGKSLMVATMSATAVEGGGQIGKAAIDYQTAKDNLEVERIQQLAKVCEMLAMILQEEWQAIMDFLQLLQESHNSAVNQALSVMTSHHQSMMKAKQAMMHG